MPMRLLQGRTLAMIFEKSSTRTRVSFDMAIRQLGGTAIIMDAGSTQLGRGETIADTARVLSRMVDAIMIRTDDHAKVEDMAAHASVPVINGLTDLSHPCQIVADLLTVIEHGKALPGLQVAWLGDGNNVLNSIVEAAGLMKFAVRIGVPEGYDCDAGFIEVARARGAVITVTRDPRSRRRCRYHRYRYVGIHGANWRRGAHRGDGTLPRSMMPCCPCPPDALFLHCLPAHRGEEVTDSVLDGRQSVIWDEAENRIHAQKSILLWAFGKL